MYSSNIFYSENERKTFVMTGGRMEDFPLVERTTVINIRLSWQSGITQHNMGHVKTVYLYVRPSMRDSEVFSLII